ncbi:MAG: hypothetical protein DHS20C12_29480 [Pseudohongiella sp.]|nr:MAG: hypothetical protein DHS20C12_29480 [Pseudohongiella sp.]
MIKRHSLFLATLLLCAYTGVSAAQLPVQPEVGVSANGRGQNIRPGPNANAKITERQAVSLARARFAGTVLRSSLVGEGANRRFQIRMENEGRVFTVFVNEATGKVTGG